MRLIREQESTRVRASLRGVLPAIVTLLLFLGGIELLGTMVEMVTDEGSNGMVLLVSVAQIVLYGVLIGVSIWGATKLEHRRYQDVGLSIDAEWLGNFTVGTAITLLGVSASLWWADVRGIRDVSLAAAEITGPDDAALLVVVFTLFGCYFLLGNIYEELVYRRLVLGNFVDGLTARGVSPRAAVVPATVVGLLLFGAYHIPLRGNLVVALDAALDGIPFALAYLLTGKLGLPVGLHFGRILIEFLHGLTRGEFELTTIVQITQDTVFANLELKLLRIGLICLCILGWVYLNRGHIRIAETITKGNLEQSRRT